MSTRRREHPAVIGAAATALLVAATGCSAPETTYTDAAGEQVTVSWRDYPGEAGQDAEQMRRAPTQAEADALSADLLADIEAAVDSEYDLDWYSREEGSGPTWFRTEGNGYGGESAYISYNSAQRQATGIPTDPADWDRIVEIVDATVQQHGFEPLVMHETYRDEREESADTYGTDDPDGWPYWNGDATGDVGWLSFGLTDRGRHPSTADADGMGGPLSRSTSCTA